MSRERHGDEVGYDEFLRRKVEIAPTQMRMGSGLPAGEIEMEFAARRAQLLRRAAAQDRSQAQD
jgi:hypothetical protein